jgi:predicted permease
VAKIFNLFRRRRHRMELDLDRELRYHFDRRVDDLVRAGSSEAEARRLVAIEFGGVTQVREEVRETWVWRWLDALSQDTRYAARSLTKSWGFALGTGTVLALGIGANTAIFSVINTVLLRPLAYPDAERIVSVETLWTNTGRLSRDVSGPDFLDWQTQADVFEVIAHSDGEDDLAIVVDGRAEFADFRSVSPGFFSVFGLPPSAGRLLTERDAQGPRGPAAVAVVSHPWAVSHFGSAQAAVGKPLRLYSSPVEIVGVAARGFSYPDVTDIWVPNGPTDTTNRSASAYHAVAKLAPGMDLPAARARMRAVGARLSQQYPENRFKNLELVPLQERLTANVEATLWVLMGAVILVLLIACANVANLLLARSAVRAREIALRAALGAGRSRVVRQLLTESFVLAGISAVAGIGLAYALLQGLVAMSPGNLPRVNEVEIDGRVLAFALALSIFSTLFFGLLPALNASRIDLSDALKQGGSKGAVSGSGGRFRSGLVIAEVALSVMLLAGAGLLLRSFQVLHRVDLGFTTERVLVAYTQYPVSNAEERRRRIQFYRDLLERLRAIPGVSAASGVGFLPMGREPRPAVEYFIQGRPEGRPGERPKAELQVITRDYFKTLEIPIRLGRDFADTDTPDRPPVGIVNESLARAAFPTGSPIGQRIRRQYSAQWIEIIGVAADTRWRDPSKAPPAEIFVASQQGAGGSLSILARTTVDETSVAGTFRALLRDMNPSIPVRTESMEDLFAEALAYPRFRTQLIGAFASMAALLAGVGIFSVLAYLVGQRTRELAVRRAVGAQTADVIRLIVGQGLRLVGFGLALGVAGALTAARLLEGLLYEIGPWDVSSHLGAVAVIGIAAGLATLLPAIRAATVNPLTALRQE